MANVKITDLTAYTDPLNTDVLAIVDVTNNVTKKVSIANMAKNVSLGTAALPGVAFDGDPNTGIYSPGADQLAISTNGTGRLFVDASGRVGVGVTSPAATWYVQAASARSSLVSTTGTNAAYHTFINTGGNFYIGLDNSAGGDFSAPYAGAIWHGGAYPLIFGTSNAERVRIDSSGRLGIGTSTVDAKLQIVDTGTAQIRIGYNTTNAYAKIGRTSSGEYEFATEEAGAVIRFRTCDVANTPVTALTIDRQQRVGIGSTAPSTPLHIGGATNKSIRIDSSTTNSCYFGIYEDSAQITINRDGATGTFTNTAKSAATLLLNGGSGGSYIEFATAAANNTSPTPCARIDSSGRLLVGTSTSRSVQDFAGNGPESLIQIEAANSAAIMSIISAGTADASRGGTLSLGRHRNATVGATPTVVQSGDLLGAICFAGGDGTDMLTKGASIACQVDGTPGADDMPGRLVFSTTADGGSSPTEAMRINSQQELLVGTATRNANGGVLQLKSGITFPATAVAATDANTLDDYEEGTWTPTVASMTTTGSPAYAGVYTKIGNLVMVNFYSTNQTGTTYTAAANSTFVSGLPFATKTTNTIIQPWTGTSGNGGTTAGGTVGASGNSTAVYFMTAIAASQGISFSLTYLV